MLAALIGGGLGLLLAGGGRAARTVKLALMGGASILLITNGSGLPMLIAAFCLGFGIGPTYPLLLAWALRFQRSSAIFFLAGWTAPKYAVLALMIGGAVCIAAAIAGGRPNPSLAVILPQRSTAAFLSYVLGAPEVAMGIWRVETFPMITARFTQPLHKIPGGALVFTARLQRRASAPGAPDHEAMLASNRTLVVRARASGGKIYPPYAPVPTRAEWQEHYGPDTWVRFAAAKKRFDPNNVLTPGAGIF